MFKKLKEAYRSKKVAKLARKDLFYQKLKKVEIKLGNYHYRAPFELLETSKFFPADESYSLTNATIEIDKTGIRIKGRDRKINNFYFQKVDTEQIKWNKIKCYQKKEHWLYIMDEENKGYLSMELRNGKCLVIYFEEMREKKDVKKTKSRI